MFRVGKVRSERYAEHVVTVDAAHVNIEHVLVWNAGVARSIEHNR